MSVIDCEADNCNCHQSANCKFSVIRRAHKVNSASNYRPMRASEKKNVRRLISLACFDALHRRGSWSRKHVAAVREHAPYTDAAAVGGRCCRVIARHRAVGSIQASISWSNAKGGVRTDAQSDGLQCA